MLVRLVYLVLGVIIGAMLMITLSLNSSTEQQMFAIAKNSYKVGCLQHKPDCEKASDEYKNNLSRFISNLSYLFSR